MWILYGIAHKQQTNALNPTIMMIIRTSFWKLYNFGFRLSICCCCCCRCRCFYSCLLFIHSFIHSFNTYLLKLFIFSFYLRCEKTHFVFAIIWLGWPIVRSVSRRFGFWTLSAPFHSQFIAEWISIIYYFSHCTSAHAHTHTIHTSMCLVMGERVYIWGANN